MGGAGDTYAAAVEMERRWIAVGALRALRRRPAGARGVAPHGLKIGLLSNSARDLDEFVAHHGLAADALLTSQRTARRSRTSRSSARVLGLLEVLPGEALMVGDTLHEDVEGARAVGMHAVLLDRDGRYPEVPAGFDDLRGLPAALGLA